jgi:hypothetical protein
LSRSYAYLTQEKLAFAVSKREEVCHNFVTPGDTKKGSLPQALEFVGVPSGMRTRVTALKGQTSTGYDMPKKQGVALKNRKLQACEF